MLVKDNGLGILIEAVFLIALRFKDKIGVLQDYRIDS
jgi:hypothetical protein